MPNSEFLRDFKEVWGNSCRSMWAELLSVSMAESYVITNYNTLSPDRLLTDMFYSPDIRGRLNDLKKDQFLESANTYRQAIITNRIVVLSASFETYLSNFLEAFIKSKPKFYDSALGGRTASGDKLFGEVMKVRGLSERIRKFGEIVPAKINSIDPKLTYLDDVYFLRNVLAHRAGSIDGRAAASLKHVKFNAGDRITLTTKQLLELAKPVISIAISLDEKL